VLRDDGQLRLRDCEEKDRTAKAVLGVSSGGGKDPDLLGTPEILAFAVASMGCGLSGREMHVE
jgi:hypothetical protein